MYFNNFIIKSLDRDTLKFESCLNSNLFFSIDLSSFLLEEKSGDELSMSFSIVEVSDSFIENADSEKIINGVVEKFVKNSISYSVNKNKNKFNVDYPVEGRSYIDRPVFRYMADSGRTYCFMYSEESDSFKVSYAVKHPYDNHYRKIGNNVAWNKMKNGNYFTFSKNDFSEKILFKNDLKLSAPSFLIDLSIDFNFFKSVTVAISNRSYFFFKNLDNFIFSLE